MSSGYENAPATIMLASHCACCGRPLLDAVSVEAGVGPDCRKTHGYEEAQGPADWEAVLRLTDGLVSVEEIDRARDEHGLANLLVHRIAVEQTGEGAMSMTDAVRALGFTQLADRICKRLADVSLQYVEAAKAYIVQTPYDVEFVAALKEGVPAGRRRFERDAKAWVVDASCKPQLWRLLRTHFAGRVANGPKGLFIIDAL